MIDFEKIEGFDWDAGNDRKSTDKHHVSQAEVEQIFFNAENGVRSCNNTGRGTVKTEAEDSNTKRKI